MSTKIKECTCAHAYQDRRYGKGKRVHNGCGSKSGNAKDYRCTVCGNKK